MNNFVDIKELGALGNGVADDSAVFNKAFRENENIFIPEGVYVMGSTLVLPSKTHIVADKNAEIKLLDHMQKGRYDFLITAEENSTDISVSGDVWNGNCFEEDRGNDLFNEKATTGVLLNFKGVSNLSLSDMTLKNPLCYYMRFCMAEDVKIENIRFDSDKIIANQDGIHFAGFCKNFVIKNLWGNNGSPNDDFLAFNADDALFRQESFDVINGPIENIFAENIHSEKCHCFIRLLSVDSEIKNVTVKNISGACKGTAVCMDAARYCRVPLFKNEDRPLGVGKIKNVLIENMSVTHTDEKNAPFVSLETNCESFRINNFENVADDGGVFALIRNTDKHCCKFTKISSEKSEEKIINPNEKVPLIYDGKCSLEFKKLN
ncbi:MAG: glycosyl hydrolase family 28 protein [Clostridia bacterium]|nr:glycosyl hydrolase family 28 protein [Clostridia bacterium]